MAGGPRGRWTNSAAAGLTSLVRAPWGRALPDTSHPTQGYLYGQTYGHTHTHTHTHRPTANYDELGTETRAAGLQ